MSRWGWAALLAALMVACDDATAPVEFDWEVVEVDLAPADRVLVVGDTMRLTVYPKNADGVILGSTGPITWDSDDDAIATVRANGMFGTVEARHDAHSRRRRWSRGIGCGNGNRAEEADHIDPDHAGQSDCSGCWLGTLEAKLLAADGSVLGGRPVSWSSSQTIIATVTSLGSSPLAVATAQAQEYRYRLPH